MKLSTTVTLSALLLAGVSTQALAQQQTVTVMGYSGLFQERYTKAVVEPFMKANPGIKVEYFPMPNSAQMLGTLRAQKAAPQADVVIMDVSVSKAATDEKLLTKIDETVSKNVADLYPNARIADVDGVAVTFDNLVMLTNADQVKTAPTSWTDLAKPEFKGKVAIPGMPDIQGLSLVLILDKAAGGTDYLKSVD
jgi:putative spermidine/putrescine transport system substrate-binding protein